MKLENNIDESTFVRLSCSSTIDLALTFGLTTESIKTVWTPFDHKGLMIKVAAKLCTVPRYNYLYNNTRLNKAINPYLTFKSVSA